jgi:3D (Asp-Asp-Asp) domain-containing protein
VLVRLSLGLLLALACGVVAGYYNTQKSDAAPVGLMVVEPSQAVRTLTSQTALTALPLPDAHDIVQDARLEDSLAIIRAEMEQDQRTRQRSDAQARVTAATAPRVEVPQPKPRPAVRRSNDSARSFNNRALKPARTIRMLVTAYSPDERSCGASADGITASGYSVWTNGMKLVAADTRVLPFGTIITVPGYNRGRPVPVLDRGGAIKGNRLDLLFPTHEAAVKWGKKWIDVQVWEYAD